MEKTPYQKALEEVNKSKGSQAQNLSPKRLSQPEEGTVQAPPSSGVSSTQQPQPTVGYQWDKPATVVQGTTPEATKAVEVDPRRNMNDVSRMYETKLTHAAQPFKINQDKDNNSLITLDNPDAHLRDLEGGLLGTIAGEAAQRMAHGHYQNLDVNKILNGDYLNYATGELIDDDTPTGKFMKDMKEQLSPMLESWKAKHHAMYQIAHDASHTKENKWQMNLSELKDFDKAAGKDIGKNLASGATDFLTGISHQFAKLGIDASMTEDDARRAGFKNLDTYKSVVKDQSRTMFKGLGDLVQHMAASNAGRMGNTNANEGTAQTWDGITKQLGTAFSLGLDGLENNSTSEELRSALETLGQNPDDVAKIKDTNTLINAVVDASAHMTGSMLPGGGLNVAGKIAGATTNAGLKLISKGVNGRYEAALRAIGNTVMETNRGKKFVAEVGDVAATRMAMATPAGKALVNFNRILSKAQPLERAAKDALTFGIDSLGSSGSLEEAQKATENGFAFGLTTGLLGKTFSRIAGRSLAGKLSLDGLSGFSRDLIEANLNRRTQIASAVAGIIGMPVGNVVGELWQTGGIHNAFTWDDFGKRLLVDGVMGGIFGTPELMHGLGKNGRIAAKMYEIRKDYYDAIEDMVRNDDAGLGNLTDLAKSIKEKIADVRETETNQKTIFTPKSESVEVKEQDADVLSSMEVPVEKPIVDEQTQEIQDIHNEILGESGAASIGLPSEVPSPRETTQSADFRDRYKILYGRDYNPEKTSIVEHMEVATAPLFEGDALHASTFDAYKKFIKAAGKSDVGIEFVPKIELKGTERPMSYDANSNTIKIAADYKSTGNLNQLAHTLAEEFTHAVMDKELQKPEVAKAVNDVREHVITQWQEGKYDHLNLMSFDGSPIPVSSDKGFRTMRYHLSSPEEFVAGAYNGNLPLGEILRNTKLPGQKRYTAFEKIATFFDNADVIKAYRDMDHTERGAWAIDDIPTERLSMLVDNIEKTAKKTLLERKNENKVFAEKATGGFASKVYGNAPLADISARWGTIMRKQGAEGLLAHVEEAANEYNDRMGVRGDAVRANNVEAMKLRAKAYLLNYANDEKQTVIAIFNPNGEMKAMHIADEEARSDGAVNEVKTRGNGQPFAFYNKPNFGFRQTLGSFVKRIEKSPHVTTVFKEFADLLKGAKNASVQYYEQPQKDGTSIALNSYPETFKDPAAAHKSAYELFKQTGVFTLPNGDMLDVRDVFKMIQGAHPQGVELSQKPDGTNYAVRKGEDLLHHVHNSLTYEWLKSAEGGKDPALADALGNHIDIAKILELAPHEGMTITMPELLNKTVWGGRINNPRLNNESAMHLKEVGFDIKMASALYNKIKPLWYDQISSNRRRFGIETFKDSPEAGMKSAFEAVRLSSMLAYDPALKTFARSKKLSPQGDELNSGKFAEKYLSSSMAGDSYKTIHADVLPVLVKDKDPLLFDESGKPNAERWNSYGFNVDEQGNIYENVLVLSNKNMQDYADVMPLFASEIQNDGASIFVNDRTLEMYNHLAGVEDVCTFKNSHKSSDDKHTIITKTAYHAPVVSSDNPLYAPYTRLMASLKAQGISRIKFDSSIKSSGTYAPKSATADLPGLENKIVYYGHKANLLGAEQGLNVKDIEKAAYDHVLNGGKAPEWMIHKENLVGEQGQQWISTSRGARNFDRAFTQVELPHAARGGWWNDLFGAHLAPVRAKLDEQKRKTITGVKKMLGGAPADHSSAYEYGEVLRRVHDMVYQNFDSDDPAIQKFASPELLRSLARSYNVDDNGMAYATEHAAGLVQAYPTELHELGAKLVHNDIENANKVNLFGKSMKLMPNYTPLDGLERMASKELSRIRQKDDPGVQELHANDLIDYHAYLQAKHFDEKGNWRPDSNGVLIGELDLEDINNEGTRRHGKQFKKVGLGSKFFGDLKPGDAASSNPALEIVGTFPGRGMSMGDHLLKTTGRDQDGDDFGGFFETPDWQGEFIPMHDKMTDYDVIAKDRTNRTYQGVSPDDLSKGLKEYVGKTNKTAMVLGTTNAPTDQSPLSADYWKHAYDADQGLGIMTSYIGALTSYHNAGQRAVVDKEAGITGHLRHPDEASAYFSFVKQAGAVDKMNASPIDWDKAKIAGALQGVEYKGEMYSVKDFADKFPVQYQSFATTVNKALFHTYDGSAKKIKKLTEEVVPSGGMHTPEMGLPTTLTTMARGVNRLKQFVKTKFSPKDDAIERHAAYTLSKQTMGHDIGIFKKAPEFLRPAIVREQGEAIRSGLTIDKSKTALIFSNDKADVTVKSDKGTLGYEIAPNGTNPGQIKFYPVAEVFEPNGRVSKDFALEMKQNGIAEDIFFGEGAKPDRLQYFPRLKVRDPNTGELFKKTTQPFDFLVYNKYDQKGREGDKLRQIGSAIGEIADDGLHAGKLITKQMLANSYIARGWAKVVEGAEAVGKRPEVDVSETRRFGTAGVLNPETGLYNPLEKVGKKFQVVEGDMREEPLPGEEIDANVHTKDIGEHERGLSMVEHIVEMREPLAQRIVTEYAKAAQEVADNSRVRQPEESGAFDLWDDAKPFAHAVVDTAKRVVQPTRTKEIFDEIKKEFGHGIIGSFKKGDYEAVFKKLDEKVREKYADIPDHMIDPLMQFLSPGNIYNQFAASESIKKPSAEAYDEFLYTHAYDTLRSLDQVSIAQREWKDTPLGQFIASTNSYQERGAAGIVLATARDRVAVSYDDPMFTTNVYDNGQLVRKGQDVRYQSEVVGGKQFLGMKLLPKAFVNFILPTSRIEKDKRVSDVRATEFGESITQADIEHVDEAMKGGWLTNNFPEITFTSSYDDATYNHAAQAHFNIDGRPFVGSDKGTIAKALNAHYEKLIPDEKQRSKVVSGVTTIIRTQLEARTHANGLAAKLSQYEELHARNADNVVLQSASLASLVEQTKEDLGHKKDYYSNLSPLEAYYEMNGADKHMMSNSLNALVVNGDKTYRHLYEDSPIVQANPTKWQEMFNYDVGKQIFGWAEDYESLASLSPKGVVTPSPLLNERLTFMKNFVEKQKFFLDGDHRSSTIRLNKGFGNSTEMMAAYAKSQGAMPSAEQEIAKHMPAGMLINAMKAAVEERSQKLGVDPMLDGFKTIVDTTTNPEVFVQKMRDDNHKIFADAGYLANRLYLENPDSSDLAHKNTTWLLNNAYGMNSNYMIKVGALDFADGVKSNIKNGTVGTTPDLSVGDRVLVHHSKFDGTNEVAKGNYIGAFTPNTKRQAVDADGKTYLEDVPGENHYAVFYDPTTGTTNVVDVDSINHILLHHAESRTQEKMDERVNSKIDAPKILESLRNNATLYQTISGNNHDMRIAREAHKGIARATDIRNVSLAKDAEESMSSSVVKSMIKGFYLRFADAAAFGVGAAISPIAPALGGGMMLKAGIGMGKSLAVNVLGNFFTSSRLKHQFDDSSVLAAPFNRLKDAVDSFQYRSKASKRELDPLAASTKEKLREQLTTTDLQRQLGVEGTMEDFRDALDNMIFMRRHDQRLESYLDNEFADWRKTMAAEIGKLDKDDREYLQNVQELKRQYSWKNMLAQIDPELYEAARARKMAPEYDDLTGTIVWHNDNAKLANELWGKLSDLHQNTFLKLANFADSSPVAAKMVGSVVEGLYKAAMKTNHALPMISKAQTSTEVDSSAGAIEWANELYDNVQNQRVAAGLERTNDESFKHSINSHNARLAVGGFERNAKTQGVLAGLTTMFTGFQQARRINDYFNAKDQLEQFAILRDAINENPELKGLLVGQKALVGDWAVWDKKTQLGKAIWGAMPATIAGSTFAVAGAMAVKALFGALLGEDPNEKAKRIKEGQSMMNFQRQADEFMRPLSRTLGNDFEAVNLFFGLADMMAAYSPWIMEAKSNQITDNHDGTYSASVASSEQMSKPLAMQDMGAREATQFGLAPTPQALMQLGMDGLMAMAMWADASRDQYTDMVDHNSFHFNGKGSYAKNMKIKQNAQDAFDYQRNEHLLKMAQTGLGIMSPILGNAIGKTYVADEDRKREALAETKKDNPGYKEKKKKRSNFE